jgi:histidyl-tRNA synthetase
MSTISFEAPRGMRDFYPEDMVWRNRIFDAWRQAAEHFGFQNYDACVVESLELLQRKSGEEVSEQIYAFEDKSGRKLALRPEMTPTLARMVAAKQKRLPFPIKWYTTAQCFRYERMTRGRKREHYQLNMDIIGSQDVLCEAEILGAAVYAMRAMGMPDKA